uniref:(northern house mosquito) hypothetical protein n=1 Tax=Culex pipiens TaxID=7175 RepID=A0A8D8DQ61_CULPI
MWLTTTRLVLRPLSRRQVRCPSRRSRSRWTTSCAPCGTLRSTRTGTWRTLGAASEPQPEPARTATAAAAVATTSNCRRLRRDGRCITRGHSPSARTFRTRTNRPSGHSSKAGPNRCAS